MIKNSAEQLLPVARKVEPRFSASEGRAPSNPSLPCRTIPTPALTKITGFIQCHNIADKLIAFIIDFKKHIQPIQEVGKSESNSVCDYHTA